MTDTVQAAHRGSPPDLTICIATYRRPQGLRALLDSLNAMSFDASLASLSIIVVENCPDAPAEASLGDVSKLSRWPLRYVTEHNRGIVAARNRALDEVGERADLIAFLDDDETVSEDWLNAMLTTLHETLGWLRDSCAIMPFVLMPGSIRQVVRMKSSSTGLWGMAEPFMRRRGPR